MKATLVTINGVTRSIRQWSRQPGAAPYIMILHRLKRFWHPEEAVFAPPHSKARHGSIRASHTSFKRPPVQLRPNPHLPPPFRPCLGSFRSVPLDLLDVVRRSA